MTWLVKTQKYPFARSTEFSPLKVPLALDRHQPFKCIAKISHACLHSVQIEFAVEGESVLHFVIIVNDGCVERGRLKAERSCQGRDRPEFSRRPDDQSTTRTYSSPTSYWSVDSRPPLSTIQVCICTDAQSSQYIVRDSIFVMRLHYNPENRS